MADLPAAVSFKEIEEELESLIFASEESSASDRPGNVRIKRYYCTGGVRLSYIHVGNTFVYIHAYAQGRRVLEH